LNISTLRASTALRDASAGKTLIPFPGGDPAFQELASP